MKIENGNRYWIPISDWMIEDIISNEIISPQEFYPKRKFGINNLPFPDNQGMPIHFKNSLTLFLSPFKFRALQSKPVYLLIKGAALKERYLERIDADTFIYKSSIYLRRGNFQARFYTESDLKLFYVRSKMSLEAKTIEKYRVEGYFKENKQSILFFDQNLDNKPTLKPLQITGIESSTEFLFDKAFNHIKGFIYGLIVGVIKEKGNTGAVESVLSGIKSKINGLITRLEMSDIFEENHFDKINETVLKLSELGETDLMYVIQKRISEIKNLQELHIQALKTQQESIKNLDEQSLTILKNELENLESIKADHDNHLKSMRNEKQKLMLRSKQLGRQSKNSSGYLEKLELKEKIDYYKEDIRKAMDKLKPINERIRAIRFELSPFMNYGKSEYLSTRDEIFYKISRDLNQKILDTKKSGDLEVKVENIDFIDKIQFDIDLIIKIQKGIIKESPKSVFKSNLLPFYDLVQNPNEQTLFEWIISIIFCFPQDSSSDVSLNKRNFIINTLYNTLSLNGFEQTIVDDLKGLMSFINGDVPDYNLQNTSVVLQNFYAFILKIQSNENLESFLLSASIPNPALARIFYATFMGFANLPKTFTKPVFGQSDNIIDKIDDHLFKNYLKLDFDKNK